MIDSNNVTCSVGATHIAKDTFVVIRAAGGRTLSACQLLIAEYMSQGCVESISERPFERALARSFQIGIDAGTKWLVTVDADLLLRPGAISQMVAFCDSLPDDVFQIQPLILDKFIGGFRKAGPRVYRTALLGKALELVPAPGEKHRPEAYIVEEMGRSGHRTVTYDFVVGIHDFEQYYRDIYRKCYVHGFKHLKWLPQVLPIWKERAQNDIDYWVGLHGLWAGMMSREGVRLDVASSRTRSRTCSPSRCYGKTHAVRKRDDPAYIESRLAEAGPPPRRPSRRERLRDLSSASRVGPDGCLGARLGARQPRSHDSINFGDSRHVPIFLTSWPGTARETSIASRRDG